MTILPWFAGNVFPHFPSLVLSSTRTRTSPGEVLQEEFLKPLSITPEDLANHIGCDIGVINAIIDGTSNITEEMADDLATALDTTSDFWLNLNN